MDFEYYAVEISSKVWGIFLLILSLEFSELQPQCMRLHQNFLQLSWIPIVFLEQNFQWSIRFWKFSSKVGAFFFLRLSWIPIGFLEQLGVPRVRKVVIPGFGEHCGFLFLPMTAEVVSFFIPLELCFGKI
ncbi:PREDICTED: uncharacterized protein LOC109156886 [Ipomoea nil]|uniref:uncharacterized protein LOC109156886 n=1 Tax=Ipomoea nil TaxID=35883 RepID=UPI000901B146|nr:PREDICTED: uncharacterized protein LOC109156886 [Ipomoea nil]